MTFGERLNEVRKKRKLSQAQLGERIGISGDAVGRYERGEVRPTIEMAVKVAGALGISLDYLTGSTDMELDKDTLERIQRMSELPEKDREHIFRTIDALIRDFKAEQAFAPGDR